MNDVYDKLNRSFKVKKLILNSDKTNCMKFAAKSKTSFNLHKGFYNKLIELVGTHKFLRLKMASVRRSTLNILSTD